MLVERNARYEGTAMKFGNESVADRWEVLDCEMEGPLEGFPQKIHTVRNGRVILGEIGQPRGGIVNSSLTARRDEISGRQ